MNIPDKQILASIYAIHDSDEEAHNCGELIAKTLQLSPVNGCWRTTFGLKTNAGLARTVLEIIETRTNKHENNTY